MRSSDSDDEPPDPPSPILIATRSLKRKGLTAEHELTLPLAILSDPLIRNEDSIKNSVKNDAPKPPNDVLAIYHLDPALQRHPFVQSLSVLQQPAPRFLKIALRHLKKAIQNGRPIVFSMIGKLFLFKTDNDIFEKIAFERQLASLEDSPLVILPPQTEPLSPEPDVQRTMPVSEEKTVAAADVPAHVPVKRSRVSLGGTLERAAWAKAVGSSHKERTKGFSDPFSREAVSRWSQAQLNSWRLRHINPNAFYYRFVEPGFLQKDGSWSEDEKALWMERYQQFKAQKWHVGSAWGLFSLALPHRVGYQCSNYYRRLLTDRVLIDPSYQFDEDGKLRQVGQDQRSINDNETCIQESELRLQGVWEDPQVRLIEAQVNEYIREFYPHADTGSSSSHTMTVPTIRRPAKRMISRADAPENDEGDREPSDDDNRIHNKVRKRLRRSIPQEQSDETIESDDQDDNKLEDEHEDEDIQVRSTRVERTPLKTTITKPSLKSKHTESMTKPKRISSTTPRIQTPKPQQQQQQRSPTHNRSTNDQVKRKMVRLDNIIARIARLRTSGQVKQSLQVLDITPQRPADQSSLQSSLIASQQSTLPTPTKIVLRLQPMKRLRLRPSASSNPIMLDSLPGGASLESERAPPRKRGRKSMPRHQRLIMESDAWRSINPRQRGGDANDDHDNELIEHLQPMIIEPMLMLDQAPQDIVGPLPLLTTVNEERSNVLKRQPLTLYQALQLKLVFCSSRISWPGIVRSESLQQLLNQPLNQPSLQESTMPRQLSELQPPLALLLQQARSNITDESDQSVELFLQPFQQLSLAIQNNLLFLSDSDDLQLRDMLFNEISQLTRISADLREHKLRVWIVLRWFIMDWLYRLGCVENPLLDIDRISTRSYVECSISHQSADFLYDLLDLIWFYSATSGSRGLNPLDAFRDRELCAVLDVLLALMHYLDAYSSRQRLRRSHFVTADDPTSSEDVVSFWAVFNEVMLRWIDSSNIPPAELSQVQRLEFAWEMMFAIVSLYCLDATGTPSSESVSSKPNWLFVETLLKRNQVLLTQISSSITPQSSQPSLLHTLPRALLARGLALSRVWPAWSPVVTTYWDLFKQRRFDNFPGDVDDRFPSYLSTYSGSVMPLPVALPRNDEETCFHLFLRILNHHLCQCFTSLSTPTAKEAIAIDKTLNRLLSTLDVSLPSRLKFSLDHGASSSSGHTLSAARNIASYLVFVSSLLNTSHLKVTARKLMNLFDLTSWDELVSKAILLEALIYLGLSCRVQQSSVKEIAAALREILTPLCQHFIDEEQKRFDEVVADKFRSGWTPEEREQWKIQQEQREWMIVMTLKGLKKIVTAQTNDQGVASEIDTLLHAGWLVILNSEIKFPFYIREIALDLLRSFLYFHHKTNSQTANTRSDHQSDEDSQESLLGDLDLDGVDLSHLLGETPVDPLRAYQERLAKVLWDSVYQLVVGLLNARLNRSTNTVAEKHYRLDEGGFANGVEVLAQMCCLFVDANIKPWSFFMSGFGPASSYMTNSKSYEERQVPLRFVSTIASTLPSIPTALESVCLQAWFLSHMEYILTVQPQFSAVLSREQALLDWLPPTLRFAPMHLQGYQEMRVSLVYEFITNLSCEYSKQPDKHIRTTRAHLLLLIKNLPLVLRQTLKEVEKDSSRTRQYTEFCYGVLGHLMSTAIDLLHMRDSPDSLLPGLLDEFFLRANTSSEVSLWSQLGKVLRGLSRLDMSRDAYIRRAVTDLFRRYFESISWTTSDSSHQQQQQEYKQLHALVDAVVPESSHELRSVQLFRSYILRMFMREYLTAIGDRANVAFMAETANHFLMALFSTLYHSVPVVYIGNEKQWAIDFFADVRAIAQPLFELISLCNIADRRRMQLKTLTLQTIARIAQAHIKVTAMSSGGVADETSNEMMDALVHGAFAVSLDMFVRVANWTQKVFEVHGRPISLLRKILALLPTVDKTRALLNKLIGDDADFNAFRSSFRSMASFGHANELLLQADQLHKDYVHTACVLWHVLASSPACSARFRQIVWGVINHIAGILSFLHDHLSVEYSYILQKDLLCPLGRDASALLALFSREHGHSSEQFI